MERVKPILDCYPCWGRGFTESLGWRFRCNNCHGTGISPTWELSDGSDASKKPKAA